MTSYELLDARSVISQNPVASNITVNTHGTYFAWAVFAVQTVVFLSLSAFTFMVVNRGRRTFNYLIAAVLVSNALNWYALASNLGAQPVTVEWYQGNWDGRGNGIDNNATRSIWISRYIDWFISTPFVIIATLLVSPVPLSTIFMTVFIETVVITCALAGALTHSQYKWGWFVFGMTALAWVCWVFFGPALLASKKAGKDVFWAYVPQVAGFGFWAILYVVCWCVSDASNLISPDSEFIFYGVLDMVSKSAWLGYFLFAVSGVEYERFGLFSSKASIFTASESAPGQPTAAPDNNVVGRFGIVPYKAPATTKETEDNHESSNVGTNAPATVVQPTTAPLPATEPQQPVQQMPQPPLQQEDA